MEKPEKKTIKKAFFENRSKVVNLILVFQDMVTVGLAVLVSALVRHLLIPILGGEINWHLIFNAMIFYVLFTVLMAWWSGLYPGFGLASVHEMQKILYVVSPVIDLPGSSSFPAAARPGLFPFDFSLLMGAVRIFLCF